MNKLILAITTLIFLSLSACTPEVVCTLDFRAIMVEINGSELDQTITLEESSGETVMTTTGPFASNLFPVVTDSYLEELRNDERTFRFLGLQDGDTIINELFEIGADQCHVYKVSGPEKIEK